MNVLITGSTGFVGNNLVRYLFDKGFRIYTLNRKHHHTDNIHESYVWDNFRVENLKDIDAIIHLAGKAHDVKNTSDAEEYFTVNTELTKKLFDTFLKSEVTAFIYFSSVKAVADSVGDILYEDAPYQPRTPYGQSKQQAELYILNQPISTNRKVFVLRPCMIHGPGNKGNLNLLYEFVLKRIPYPLAAFNNRRSFLSIANLNYIIQMLLMKKGIESGIYNLADDEALSTITLIHKIGNVSQVTPRLWNIAPVIINALAKTGDMLHLPLNSERLKKLTESYVVSNSKIKKALKIDKLPVSSDEGLTNTVKSFLA